MAQPPPNVFDFIVNRRSGTILKLGKTDNKRAAVFTDKIKEEFEDKTGDVIFVEGEDIASTINNWIETNQDKTRGLIICGGDGTVLTAAEQMLNKDVTLGILPLGTNCLVSRQIGLGGSFKEAAAKYKDMSKMEEASIDVGRINGKLFLVAAVLGKISEHFFTARELMRDKQPEIAAPKFTKAGLRALFGPQMYVKISDGTGKENPETDGGRIIVISNNPIDPQSCHDVSFGSGYVKNIVESIISKGSLDSGQAGLYMIHGNAESFGRGNLSGLLKAAWKRKWTEHRSVTARTGSQFRLHPTNMSQNGKEISAIVDGETINIRYPLDIKIEPRALRVYKPKTTP